MREISSSITFEIKAGETVPMMVMRSTRLTVRGGSVWVTRSNDTEDYFLQAGRTLRLRRGERLWLGVEGAPAAQLAFSVPKRADEQCLNWFARVSERAGAWLRQGWRTV
jgi:hypothetical protein